MRAMVVTQPGPVENLRLAEMPEPQVGEDDLLIEVRATSINPVDFKIRKGAFAQGRPLPFILGYDVSGMVRGMGKAVRGFAIGDEVWANPSLMRNGADAELVCADARLAAPKPKTLSWAQAAVMPLVAITAWEALYERAAIKAGQTLLIHGGAGGVGHLAIQLAKLRGCRVLTTASRPESIELCKQVGADVVINYATEDWAARVMAETGGAGCDCIFDCVGGATLDRSPGVLRPFGKLVTIVGSGSAQILRDLFVKAATLEFEFVGAASMYEMHMESHGNILRQIAELVDQGKLRPHVSKKIKLEELAEGHRLMESGHTLGKIAVEVSPEQRGG